MSIQRFKQIIDSGNLETIEKFLDDEQSWVIPGEEPEILQCCLEGKKNVDIFKLIFDRLKNDIKDKAISKNGNSILFLALDTGKDYFEVFKNYENVNWSILDKNGNNLLHHALSLKDVSEESLNFLYEKLGGYECLFKINDDSENALHHAANLKNFKWCLEKCKTDKIKSLLHSVNNTGETPVVKLLKNKDSLSDGELFEEIINILKDKKYDFLKTDNNEQNAISLAVQNDYGVLKHFLSDGSHKEERIEIAFSAIEHGKDDLLESLEIKDKGDFIVKNHEELIKKYPKRLANFVKNDEKILHDYIKLYGTKKNNSVNDKLLNLFSKMMYLAIDDTDDKLASQCLKKYKLLKGYASFHLERKSLTIPNLLERQNSTGTTPLDYAYKNNPEMFAKLVTKSFKFNSSVSLKSGVSQESHQINQKEEISPDIADLFTAKTAESRGWYDTGGILSSLADLVIENNDSPEIFVQPGTYGQPQSLSDELERVSKRDKDVIYVRRNPIDEEGRSSAHWIVLYFFKSKGGARNLLVVDPYGANGPSAVIKEAAKKIVDNDNIYVSTTKIQRDGNSCGPISSEVARAIYSQKEKLQELLEGNNQKIDIEQILFDGLINDAKESGRINYGRGFENFNCSKIRNIHTQTAQAIGEAIDETLDQEIALLLSQDGAKVNVKQIDDLEQTLGEKNFRPMRERLDAQIRRPQLLQLSDEQKEKIEQIREKLKSELTNPQKYEIDNSLLHKFLCSASVNDIKQFFDSNNNLIESEDLSKAAFAAARDGDISRLEVFINYNDNIIYKTDVSDKSLLEVAAENSHSKIVQYIIHKHKDKNGKTAGEVSSEFLGFVDNIDNRKDAWAKDLARELKKILRKKDSSESEGLKIDEVFKLSINDKKQEKEAKNFNTDNYGDLSFYADIIRSDNREKFETALKNIKPKHNLHSLLNSNGHNLITLTAALGTPDHWKEIEKAYSKVEGRTAISASSDDKSSIGSPVQAAIIAGNLPMYNHFLDSKNGFVVNGQYGEKKNNVLHTILQSDKVELLNDIFFKFKDNKKSLVEALQQVNKDNKSPLDLALEKGHYGFFEKALDVIANHNTKTIENLLIKDDCRLIKSAVSFGNERVIERVFSLQDEYNKGVKDQLNLLNYNNHYDKENRLEKSGLLNLACQHNNVHTASYILELLKEKNKVLSKVLVNALTASISKDSNNREVFDFLFGQEIDIETFSGKSATLIHKAAECGNVHTLKYCIDKFPEILNLQDEDGKTPLHLAISNGNRKAIEFLVENGADFDKLDNKDITPFELLLGDNRFADICIDLLKHNPKTNALYRAILSGNKKLIGKLKDQSHWVLDQYNPDTLKPDPSGGETALKLALRNGIDKNLTAEIAGKSIKNFKELDEKSQKTLLEPGFLNDIVKSGIYEKRLEKANETTSFTNSQEKEAGEISQFIKSQVEKDSSLLSVTSQGTTLLYDIINGNNLDFFEEIENYIKPEVITKKSSKLEDTVLHAATKNNNIDIVKVLLEKVNSQEVDNQKNAKSIDEYDAEGYTPLQIAAKLGYKEVYDLLKKRGGNLESKTKAGDSIAHLLILSAMKDDNGEYEYQKLLKNHPELTGSINDRGDDLLATAARCANQGETSEIMKQLLENEFKHKKKQLTEKDAVKLLSNAISSNNFDAVQKIIFDNMKGKVVNEIVSTIAGDGADKTFKTRVRRTIANTITSNSQEHIDNINKAKVLSQSIKKVLSDTKAHKGSSNKVDVDTLLNFLVEDQGSYTNSKDDLFLVEEEVKVSSARKNIFIQQEELNRKFDTFFLKQQKYGSQTENCQSNLNDLYKLKISQDVFYTNCKNLNDKSIADRVFTRDEPAFIEAVVLGNKDLWDPRFVDSKGNTLLHKLAQMVKNGNALTSYIQPLIDRGFSLTKKNSEGKSAKDILEDVNVNNEIKQTVDNSAKTEEQIHEHFEKGLDSLLNSGSVDDLAKAIRNDEQGCKKYYGTVFNPFHSVVSSCFNGDFSNNYLFDKKLNCFKKLLKSNDLRSALDKTDEKRSNFLHRAVEEATANYSGSDTNKMLERILLDVARELNGSRNFKLCNELFFKQRNSNGDNVIEALSKVQNSLNTFKKLEWEFGKNTFADECDLNLILVNAAGNKNDDLFEHVIEKYALNRFRAPSEEGQFPLHAAVMSGDKKTVLAVLKSGANINQINSSGRTALHELLIFLRDNPGSQEHMDLAHYLTSRGAFFGHYQEEGENEERGEITEVIESMEGGIQEKVLFTIAHGRSDFYDMKYKLLNEAGNFIKLKNKGSPLELDLDISGSVVFAKINNGTFKSSQFLNGDVCKSNHLTTSYFDIDGCKGYVQKSASGKRNYVIFEDGISEENGIKVHHPTKIKVWLSKENSITVLVSADGTVEPAEISNKVMGVEIKNNLSEYKARRKEFESDYFKYKDYIEKLWEKVDSKDEYKNEVYIGGIPLKDALMRGRWRDQNVQKEKQTQSEEQERIQESPENNTPNYSRGNSKGDGVGEIIEDVRSDINQAPDKLQPKSNNVAAAGTDDQPINDEKGGDFLKSASQPIKEIAKGFKDIADIVEKNQIPNKLMDELEKRLAQPNKGLKKLNPREYYISPKTKERLGDLLGSEIDSQYLENKISSKINSQVSNSQEVKNIQSQQAETLTNENKKKENFYNGISKAIKGIEEGFKGVVVELNKENFYKAVKNVAEALKDVMEESQMSNSQEQKSEKKLKNVKKRMELNLSTINCSSPNTPDSGYGSAANSPSQEEKGMLDSRESEKSEINIKHNQSFSEEYIMENREIKLDDIKLEIEEQEKGTKDSCESEKQKNNCLLDKSKTCTSAESIKIIQKAIGNLTPAEKTENYMGPKVKEKLNGPNTCYKNERTSQKNKPGRVI